VKRQRQHLFASRNRRRRFNHPPKRTTAAIVVAEVYLPDECWEHVFKFLNNHNHCYLRSPSVVSKRFLSITNRLLFSLTVNNQPHPFLLRLFHRFTKLKSLDLSGYKGDIDHLLREISCFSLNLTSLDISGQTSILEVGLRAFSKNITTLTSLICFNKNSIN